MTPSIASGADKMASADHPGSVAASSNPAWGGDRHLTASSAEVDDIAAC